VLLLSGSTWRPEWPWGVLNSLPAAILGAALALAGGWAIWRCTSRPARPAPLPVASPLRRYWPLLFVAGIYTVMGGLEVLVGGFPHLLAFGRLPIAEAPWQAPTVWRYELRNIADEPVGQAQCRLSEDGADLILECQAQRDAFEVRRGSSYFNLEAWDARARTRWQGGGLQVLSAEMDERHGERAVQARAERQGEALLLSVSRDGGPKEELTLPADVLLPLEWPWRLATLPFEGTLSHQATLAWPNRMSEAGAAGPTSEETFVVVAGAEPMWSPAGRFVVWRVEVGDQQVAWYDAQAPHTLVRYEDHGVTYLLTGVEMEEPLVWQR